MANMERGSLESCFLKACCVVHVNVSCTTVTLDWSLCSLNLVFGESILCLMGWDEKFAIDLVENLVVDLVEDLVVDVVENLVDLVGNLVVGLIKNLAAELGQESCHEPWLFDCK